MSSCLENSDIRMLGDSILAQFDRRVASIPEDLCGPFHIEARQLESELLGLHRMVALCAKRQDDLKFVSDLWDLMVGLCDSSAAKLAEMVKKHPNCGAQVYYDRILDLRNRCQRLKMMHS